jgi:hypothetical protein
MRPEQNRPEVALAHIKGIPAVSGHDKALRKCLAGAAWKKPKTGAMQ